MKHPRIAYLGLPFLFLVAALAAFLLSGAITSRAVQDPVISIDMVTTGNAFDDTQSPPLMSVGTIDNCVTTASPGNNLAHLHTLHVVVQNVEDLIGWQVRVNYLGDRFRPNTVNFTPFLDNNTGQNISFVNLPIDSTTLVHRDLVSATSIPPAAAGPQTAGFGSTYVGAQNAAISPDTPAKAVPDDSSYSAPSGGVLASFTAQVIAGNAGQPSLFLNLDDGSPNGPGSGYAFFTGTTSMDVLLPVAKLGDGYHGEGATCVALDCVTPECPSGPPTPTAPSTPTPPPTPSPTPTPPPTPITQSAKPTPTPIRIPLTLTLNRTGTVSPDGFRVGLSGTLSCTAGHSGFLNVIAFQFARGQVLLSAFGSASFRCSGVVQNWAVTAESFTGFFKPGHANVRARLFTFGPAGFDEKEVAAQVRLRRSEPPPESPPESPPQSPPIFGRISGTAGVVGGTAVISLLAVGMTLGFVRVVRRNERRDHDI